MLLNTVAQRGKHYKSLRGFTIRFENDDTSAARDTKHFQDMLRALNFHLAQEIVIGKSDKHPSWTLESYFQSLVKEIESEDERNLVIGHFAGHAKLDFT